MKNSNDIANSRLKITQVASAIGKKFDQEQTLIGLGLNKLHRVRFLENTRSVRGMVEKVKHLVKTEIIN